MFRAKISSTPFVSDIANDFFQDIKGASYKEDVTFLSTLRALVAPRIKDGDILSLLFGSSAYMKSDIERANPERYIKILYDEDCFPNGSINIHSLNNSKEDAEAGMKVIKSSFCTVYPDWVMLDKITDFYRKRFEVLCFIEPETKRVAIFVDNADYRKIHYLQCSILAFLPWYFDPENGVTALEMQLIQSLRETNPGAYIDAISKIAEQYDFRSCKIKRLLKGFETRFELKERENVLRMIENLDSDIRVYNENLAATYRRRRDSEIKLLGINTRISQAKEDSEIMDYFLANKKLSLISVDNDTMTFVASDYLEFFDEEMAENVINNANSYLYSVTGGAPAEDVKMFAKALFIDKSIRIKMCAAYKFEFGIEVRGEKDYPYGAEFRDYTPNPHIDRFSCLGNYRQAINQLLSDGNYIMAIEQCIASAKSLNIGDSCVMEEFFRRLFGTSYYRVNIKCIELPDGSIVNTKGAIEYLKSEENKNEQTD